MQKDYLLAIGQMFIMSKVSMMRYSHNYCATNPHNLQRFNKNMQMFDKFSP